MSRRTLIGLIILLVLIIIRLTVPNYCYQKGMEALNKKDYKKASKYLYEAHIFDLTNLNYKYYYVKALTHNINNYSAQKKLYMIAKSNNNDSATNLAKYTLNNYRNNILKAYGDTYIEQVPSGIKVIRWNEKLFPLKVYITTETKIPRYYLDEIKKALSLWANATGFIRFKLTKDIQDANITITIKPLPKDICNENNCKYTVGITSTNVSGDTLEKMDIIIYDKNPYNDYHPHIVIFNTVMHEIGHALGIMGHSYNSEDLMYPTQKSENNVFAQFRTSSHSITTRDINTLKLLYKLKPNITNAPIASDDLIYPPIVFGNSKKMISNKLKEAINYNKENPELSLGYINLAKIYMDIDQLGKADSALKRAVNTAKSPDEKFIAYYNSAILNYKREKYYEAIKFINMAKLIKTNSDLAELEFNVKNKLQNKKK